MCQYIIHSEVNIPQNIYCWSKFWIPTIAGRAIIGTLNMWYMNLFGCNIRVTINNQCPSVFDSDCDTCFDPHRLTNHWFPFCSPNPEYPIYQTHNKSFNTVQHSDIKPTVFWHGDIITLFKNSPHFFFRDLGSSSTRH